VENSGKNYRVLSEKEKVQKLLADWWMAESVKPWTKKTKKNSFGRKEHSSLQARLRVMRPLPVSLSVCHSESGLVNAKHREEGLYTRTYIFIY
jgi:hypothetical protein